MKKLLSILLLTVSLYSSEGINQAETYANNSHLQFDWATYLIEQYDWKGSETVLDIGCGDGKITYEIAKKTPNGNVLGIDISAKMVQLASSQYERENVSFKQLDALDLTYDNKFDVVVSFCALHWILDQTKIVRKIAKSLVPKGKLILIHIGASPNNISTIAESLIKKDKWASYFPNFSGARAYFELGVYEELLEQEGLVPILSEAVNTSTPFKNRKALEDWVAPLLNFIDHLSIEKQGEFIADFVDAMLIEDPPLEDGTIEIHHQKLNIIAEKQAF